MHVLRYSLLLVIACKEFIPVATEVKKDSSPIVTKDKQRGEFTAYLDKLGGRKRLLAKVNPNSLSELSIDFITAGVQSNKYGKFVRLYFHANIQRDYLEIARCAKPLRNEIRCLFGKDPTTITAEQIIEFNKKMKSGEGETVNDSGKYDCWNTGIIGNECTELGRVYSAEHHVDLTAGDGKDYFYVARPCIIEARIKETYAADSQPCSNDLAFSNTVTTPAVDSKPKELQEEIDKRTKELNEMVHNAYLLTVELSKVMAKHEEETIENQRKRRMKEGIAMIAGMAIGAAGSVFSMSYAEPSMLWQDVGKDGVEGVTRVLENGDLQQLIEHKPAASDAVGAGLEAGKALGAAFADILASPDDYPKACAQCLMIRGEIAATVGDMDPTNPNSQHGGHIYQELLQQLQDLYKQLQESNADQWKTEQWQQKTEKEQADEETAG